MVPLGRTRSNMRRSSRTWRTRRRSVKKRKAMAPISDVWESFTKIKIGDSVKKAKCKHCSRELCCDPRINVASESAFSTGGRVLDDFGSSPTPYMVERLVCTQDCLRRFLPVNIEEDLKNWPKLRKKMLTGPYIPRQSTILFLSPNLPSQLPKICPGDSHAPGCSWPGCNFYCHFY